jgi:integrase
MAVKDVRIRHLKAALENGPTPIIKVKMKSVFNLMLDYAVEYELVEQNYAKAFDLPKEVTSSVREAKNGHIAFTDEEMTKIWKHFQEIRLGEIFIIQCYSGWRPEELLEIELENVDMPNWTFKGGMKTAAGKDRVVPIHPLIRPFVDQHFKQSRALGGKYLFSNPNGIKDSKKLSYEVYLECFQSMISKLGLNLDHRPHDCRKHFVTLCKKYHVDEYAIKYMVGHSIKDITEKTYTERSTEWLHQEISKIRIV